MHPVHPVHPVRDARDVRDVRGQRPDAGTAFMPSDPLTPVLARAQADPLLGALLRDAWRHGRTVGEYIARDLRPRVTRSFHRRMRRLGTDADRFLYLHAHPRAPASAPPEAPDPVDLAVDLAVAESFPASDPPAWGPVCHAGRPTPAHASRRRRPLVYS